MVCGDSWSVVAVLIIKHAPYTALVSAGSCLTGSVGAMSVIVAVIRVMSNFPALYLTVKGFVSSIGTILWASVLFAVLGLL